MKSGQLLFSPKTLESESLARGPAMPFSPQLLACRSTVSRTKAEYPGMQKSGGLSVPELRAQNQRLRAEITDLTLKNEELREKLAAPRANRAGGMSKRTS